MEYQIVKKSDLTVITLDGRLDTANSAAFSVFVDKALAENPTNVEFDCTKLEYVASSGLRIFLNTYKKLLVNQGKLTLSNVQPDVMSILKMTGFTSFLSIN